MVSVLVAANQPWLGTIEYPSLKSLTTWKMKTDELMADGSDDDLGMDVDLNYDSEISLQGIIQ